MASEWEMSLHLGETSLLILITSTVCVIYMAVFEYQIQAMVNMAAFNRGPRCHVHTCFWYPKKNIFFGMPKASDFPI